MFSTSQSCLEQSVKFKQQSFKKQTTHQSKQNIIQSLRYMTFSELIDWHVPLPAFQNKVSNLFNYYTILNTLFAISEEMEWRLYIPHMNLLISTFYNIMCGKRGTGLQDIGKINEFGNKLEKLFLLKDLTLHQHLMVLVKMLLAYNPKYGFLRESQFALILIESATYNHLDSITEIIWILSQIQVSSQTIFKLLKNEIVKYALEKGDICPLPLITIVANFLSDPNQNQNFIQQLIMSDIFSKIFKMGLSSNKIEIINETILMFNNGICFSPVIRNILLKDSSTIESVMSFECPETEKFREIMSVLQYQAQHGNYGQQQQNMMMDADYSM